MTRQKRNLAKKVLKRLNKSYSGLFKFDAISTQSEHIPSSPCEFGLAICRPVKSKKIIEVWDLDSFIAYLSTAL